ncbi:transketolase [Desulfobacula phenolica]|uniref:Transketolase n=1 Tax=Desulfobacula phenolica TaxID=90732 RepID=A0A1H2DRV5_9BACT|nr:transketolase [Desulfobacula phenolica]SDT85617.1 transketolase [Desulfobacula phenolica]
MMTNMEYSVSQLEQTARQIRAKLVEMSHYGKASHLGSALSSVDILVSLYWKKLGLDQNTIKASDRNRFILSKGHAASALYAALAFKNIIPKDLLETYCQQGSKLEEHPGPGNLPGVEAATGSLGHGLSIGLGMSLAGKIKKQAYHVFVLLSDGECNEGSVWEAAMFAPAKGLNRVCVIIDFNKWQATDRSCEVMALQPLKEKWRAFGWNAMEIDGHDMDELSRALSSIPDNPEKPTAIIANTIKGKGISFMEDDNNWHYRIPNEQEMFRAKEELGIL